jgi:rubrerythrin
MQDNPKPMTPMEIAEFIVMNTKDESNAIHGYTRFLSRLETTVTSKTENKDLINDLREIISDEQNHMNKLNQRFIQYTGIQPATD